eukprot:UN05410
MQSRDELALMKLMIGRVYLNYQMFLHKTQSSCNNKHLELLAQRLQSTPELLQHVLL